MSFQVEPRALRAYAKQLEDARAAAEAMRTYVATWGSFSAHQKGLLGVIWPNHQRYVAQLDAMLYHLRDLIDASSTALDKQADRYELTDREAEARIDASYPAAPRTTGVY